MARTCGSWSLLLIAAMLLTVFGVSAGEWASANGERYYGVQYPLLPNSLADMDPLTIRSYSSIPPELYADTMVASVGAQRMFRSTLPSIADYSQTAHMVTNSSCAPNNKWVMWDTPFLSRDIRDRSDGYHGFKTTVSGFATGLSRMLGESSVIGLAIGYDGRKLTNKDDYHWHNKADAFHAALYGGTTLGCFFIDGYAGYSRSWQRSEYTAYSMMEPDALHKANYDDTVLSAGLKASYVWVLSNGVRITPAIGLDFSHIRMGEFINSSNSGIYPIHIAKTTHSSLQVPLTVSVNKTFTSNFLTFGGACSLWTPEVRAGYIPQFGVKRIGIDFVHFGADEAYHAKSTRFGGSYGTMGAGLKLKLRDRVILAVDYDYTFGKDYGNHFVTATYGFSF